MKTNFILLFLMIASALQAQNCKPDLEKQDKISKMDNIAWQAMLYESGIGNSFINTSDWYISMQFGRYGNNDLLTIFIDKYEESAQNASFESQYRGQEGQPIYLAFSQGEPLSLIVQNTSTTSKMNNLLGKLVTTVKLGVFLTPDKIDMFKKALENGALTAIRLQFANKMQMEKDVKASRAKVLTEKFNCFYEYYGKTPKKEIPSPYPTVAKDAPDNLPRNAENKIEFEEVIPIDGVSKDQLFQRAKNWMVNYYKSDQLAVNNPTDGQLIRQASFLKTYQKPNGTKETDTHWYNISISVKDGKYKYSITDIVMDDGKEKMALETGYDMLAKSNNLQYKRYVDEQIYSGVSDILKNLKTAMASEIKSKSDW
ncbi:MAG: DUF4468 domain-containing protein [Bacteroidetes bacterium]|nr:DUF4468 domain-containing protein [Bacteroidota bacterium]